MKIGGFRAASLAWIGLCLLVCRAQALDLYINNIDAGLPGPGLTPDGVWAWTAGPDAIFTDEVTETGGVGGTQSFRQTTDAIGAINTSWYFVRGFGQFSVFADENNPLAGGVAGSNNPAQYRFSMDVNVSGNNGGEGATPLAMGISATDMDYEVTHNIDVNGDGDFDDGAEVYNHGDIKPTVSVSDQWVNVSFTFDEGTAQALDPDIPLEDQVFSNGLALQWYLSYGSGGFGLDADNVVNVDNFRIEFLEVVGFSGDFNDDGMVGAEDYVVWRKNETANNPLPNDDGLLTQAQRFDLWRANFGEMTGNGSGTAVPEPATLALAVMIGVGCCFFSAPRRRRRKT